MHRDSQRFSLACQRLSLALQRTELLPEPLGVGSGLLSPAFGLGAFAGEAGELLLQLRGCLREPFKFLVAADPGLLEDLLGVGELLAFLFHKRKVVLRLCELGVRPR